MKVICIQGATASGKSELAEKICRQIPAEIVSADSMQIYRGMDIGTAKIPPGERSVPYHCIDIRDPGQPYSAALFQRDARAAIEAIEAQKRRAVLCGGTGLYVRAALDSMDFATGEQEANPVREHYTKLAERIGAKRLHALLEQRDPASAAVIHPNNVRRVIRALEMLEAGDSYARRKAAFKQVTPFMPSVKLGVRVDPAILNERINRRVGTMIERGLIEEVERLLAAGFRDGLTAPQAIGYKEIVEYLDGRCTLDAAADAIRQATRRYAKRQRTWLKSDESINWLDGNKGVTEAMVQQALELVGGS